MQISNFSDVITVLQRFRNVYHSQLDAKGQDEIDFILKKLQEASQSKDSRSYEQIAHQAVQTIVNILQIVTNLNDLMK